jgi:DNA-directed RNA polymerase specialized sigma24 family protein
MNCSASSPAGSRTLPDDEHEVVELLFYQELPQEEAARLLDVSVRTVQRR